MSERVARQRRVLPMITWHRSTVKVPFSRCCLQRKKSRYSETRKNLLDGSGNL